MSPEWNNFITAELKKDYGVTLKAFITARRSEATVLPSQKDLFNCFEACDWSNLKVIIIGQDPYPHARDAHGIAFSSPSDITPYSLQNIFDEIYKDFFNGDTGGVKVFKHNNLTQWGKQGVLLINSIMTTEENEPAAHKSKGWEIFIENLIKMINDKHPGKLVWMLWGASAKKFKPLIQDKHLILESEHPAAVRHNAAAWFGNRHFTKANNFITKTYKNVKAPVNWGVWN